MKQKSMTPTQGKKKYSIHTDPGEAQMMNLLDNIATSAIMNVFKYLNEHIK
jgi:hypothetical protein